MPDLVVSPSLYPTLETIMNLVRVHLNDWIAGLNNITGEGQITYDSAPQTLPALNSSIRTLYRKLRNAGAPTLIKDGILVTMPPVNPNVNPPNSGVQCQLTYAGFFDGWKLISPPSLPQDFMYPLEVHEQQPASNGPSLPFQPMRRASHGLPSIQQGFYNSVWEWRGDSLWFPGTLEPITAKLRYKAAFPQFFGPEINFSETQVPILDCEEYLGWQCAYLVAAALEGITPASQSVQNLKAEANEALFDLKQAYVLSKQEETYRRARMGQEGGDYNGDGWIG